MCDHRVHKSVGLLASEECLSQGGALKTNYECLLQGRHPEDNYGCLPQGGTLKTNYECLPVEDRVTDETAYLRYLSLEFV